MQIKMIAHTGMANIFKKLAILKVGQISEKLELHTGVYERCW